MAVTPVLAGHTLANPSEYEESRVMRAVSRKKADGTFTVDVINASAGEIQITMRWKNLTITQRDTLWTAYQAAVNGQVAFTNIEGVAWTVIAEPEGSGLQLSAFLINGGGSTRYRGEMKLRTV